MRTALPSAPTVRQLGALPTEHTSTTPSIVDAEIVTGWGHGETRGYGRAVYRPRARQPRYIVAPAAWGPPQAMREHLAACGLWAASRWVDRHAVAFVLAAMVVIGLTAKGVLS